MLFGIGVYVVLARRHAVLVLMGVELMLNAVNLNLVAFDAWWHDALDSGQVLALFVIAIAAAEIGLGLAIVLLVFRTHQHIDVDELRELADRDDRRAVVGRADQVGALVTVAVRSSPLVAAAVVALVVGHRDERRRPGARGGRHRPSRGCARVVVGLSTGATAPRPT